MTRAFPDSLSLQTEPISAVALALFAAAAGDHNPLHLDESVASAAGFEQPLIHGMLTMALVGKYVSDLASGSEKVLEFGGRFTKPVIVPAGVDVDVTVSATVTDVADGKATLSLSATSAGVKVLGMAKAVVSL